MRARSPFTQAVGVVRAFNPLRVGHPAAEKIGHVRRLFNARIKAALGLRGVVVIGAHYYGAGRSQALGHRHEIASIKRDDNVGLWDGLEDGQASGNSFDQACDGSAWSIQEIATALYGSASEEALCAVLVDALSADDAFLKDYRYDQRSAVRS